MQIFRGSAGHRQFLFAQSRVWLSACLPFAVLLGGCASGGLQEEIVRLPESHAEPLATTGLLAELAEEIEGAHGSEYSGFGVLDSSHDGLYWRLALIDSAVSSLDILTYLWYPDVSGKLVLERAIYAARRGVKVRIIADDLILQGHDQVIANMEAQPNIEFRIFNPRRERGSMLGRAGEAIAEMERPNTRMHDKLMIADSRAAVVGGRNLGDHYFGLSDNYNFHDTDLLGFGEIARQANDAFDSFWNSKWVVSAQNLTTEPSEALAQQQWQGLLDNSASAPQLASFPRQPRDWSGELRQMAEQLPIGRSKLVYDETAQEQIDQKLISSMFNFFGIASKELFIMNAYIIPAQQGIDFLQGLGREGRRRSPSTGEIYWPAQQVCGRGSPLRVHRFHEPGSALRRHQYGDGGVRGLT
jgi:putative cardiolipin synthase